MQYKIHTGLCQEVLAEIEPNSIDAIVTDPPYGLSFMGKKWDYEVPSVKIWQACLRALKPGGHLLAFAGTRTQHRMAVNIEDAGFEIRDMIAWVYGSGFPKSHNISKAIDKANGVEFETLPASGVGFMNPKGKGGYNVTKNKLTRKEKSTPEAMQWEGWGTALKPSWECITVARKPFNGTVAENVLKHGTGAINIDGCRVGYADDSDLKQQYNNFKGHGKQNHSAKSTFTSIENHDSNLVNTQGRFPANLIHDGSHEVTGLFPMTGASKAANRGLQHSGRHGGLADIGSNIKEGTDTIRGHNDNGGSAARFFYCAKASKADRDEGLDGLPIKDSVGTYAQDEWSRQNMGNTPDSKRQGRHNHHPTVKPTALMRYLCRLVTPPNGTVLDPFAGSGSTGKGAILEGFTPILIEADEQWADIIKARCDFAVKKYKQDNAQLKLF